jgi:hypothetical protein
MKRLLLVGLLVVCTEANAGLISLLGTSNVPGVGSLDIIYNDTGDGLLQFEEIEFFASVHFTTGDPNVDGIYAPILAVPNIPGVSTGNGGNAGDSWDFERVSDGKEFSVPASTWRYSLSEDVEAIRIVDRDVDLWFGTLSVMGVDAPSYDFLQLSNLVVDDLRAAIEGDAATDARLKNNDALWTPWIQPNMSGIEWVLEEPSSPPLNARQNLLDAYTAAAALLEASFGPGSLTFPDFASSAASYLLGTFDSVEVAPVLVGDTDEPMLFGDEGHAVTIHNNFFGNVHYFVQNATWTARAPTSVPEPNTISLLAGGLIAFGILRRRRA